jgi:hypothetical protein
VSLPLTKSLDAATDFPLLDAELKQVDRYAIPTERRWEYAMALRAWTEWARLTSPHAPPYYGLDVGGAGSPLTLMLASHAHFPCACQIIDPTLNTRMEAATVEPLSQDVIFCTSVLEHVDFVLPLLKAMDRALAPGGLLFLTMDGCNSEGKDVYHFHWMRKRIYNVETWQELYKTAHGLGFSKLGRTDWRYHGSPIYNYTFFSLALLKSPQEVPDGSLVTLPTG